MQRPKPGKGQLPGLESGPVPLLPIRDTARQQLIDLIDTKRGKKALVLDPAISGPLTQLDAGLSELFTEHGVAKLMYLERLPLNDVSYTASEPPLPTIRPLIYILRTNLDNAALLAWQLKNSAGCLSQHEISVFWVPRRSVACERLLEEEGVYGAALHGEFPLELVALEEDVVSLELDRAFRECVLEGDTSALFYAAAGLVRLQLLYGLIPRIQGKGAAAAFVKETAIRMLREQQVPPQPPGGPRLHRVILLDREVDLVTPMMTQITYEGLIDEVTGIKQGAVQYAPRERKDAGGSSSAAAAGGPGGGGDGGRGRVGTTLLNSTDPFYKEFRDLPYYITSQRLQAYAKEAQREYTELGTKDLSELKNFVKGLPKLLLLDRLSDIAVPVAEVVKGQSFHDRLRMEMDILEGYDLEEAVRYTQELMWRGSDLLSVLRLVVLLVACQGGLPRKHLDALRGELLSVYGHQHLATLQALERAGLLHVSGPGAGAAPGTGGLAGARSSFPAVRKALRLSVNDDTQMDNPTDVSYLYKGYAPISIRLVESALTSTWAPLGPGAGAGGRAEGPNCLPGPQFDLEQAQQADGSIKVSEHRGGPHTAAAGSGAAAAAGAGAGSAGDARGGKRGQENVLVVFLGGVTFTEISALRFLSSRPGAGQRYLVMATKIINGSTLLDTFIDPEVRHFLGTKDALGRKA